ncbi:MAG: hypothetical protein QXY90_04690 [Candidatus Anstonellales archaeon]
MGVEREKVSVAKLMTPKGDWEGPAPEEVYYGMGPKESPTGGALIVDQNKWPVKLVKPEALRPISPNGGIDRGGVVENAYPKESTRTFIPISDIGETSMGAECEFRLVGIEVSPEMHERTKEACKVCGGYTTYEVASDMIEANRPVVTNASFQGMAEAAEKHTEVIVRTVEGMGGRVIMTSSRPNTNRNVTSAPDPYVDAMIGHLANGFLNLDYAIMAWIAYTSQSMLGTSSVDEIIEKAKHDHPFARNLILEFDASGLHSHIRINHQEPNPHFYAFFLNHEMGVIGPAMSVHTLSGPFRNGTYTKLHDNRLIHRLLFRTAGYQPPFYPMGSYEYLEEASRNITQGAASSLTRAGITGDRSHGDARIRTEPFRTAERLFGCAHPLPEVEAVYAFAGNVNAAILSHYYVSDGRGKIPDHAKAYYCEPNKHRYHINRLQFAAHGPFSILIDGNGKAVTFKRFIEGYSAFVVCELRELGIHIDEEDLRQFQSWLVKPIGVPEEGWSVANYHDPKHPDYGKGALSTHLIAELAVKVTRDKMWRTQYKDSDGNWKKVETYDDACNWWRALHRVLPEGHYEDEIREIVRILADAIHNRYTLHGN